MGTQMLSDILKKTIKSIPNYPKEGIIFRDVTSLLESPEVFKTVIDTIVNIARDQGFTKVIGTEARGFIFAAPVAIALNLPLVLVRKPNKLPRETIEESYSLEYGTDTFQIHVDSISKGDKVLVIDDLLATGGTILACNNLVKRLGGQIASGIFVINLPDLDGEKELNKAGIKTHSLVSFEGE
ncbi:MAG: adenine phosphoribosyltransferase [Psittacicella sp.]